MAASLRLRPCKSKAASSRRTPKKTRTLEFIFSFAPIVYARLSDFHSRHLLLFLQQRLIIFPSGSKAPGSQASRFKLPDKLNLQGERNGQQSHRAWHSPSFRPTEAVCRAPPRSDAAFCFCGRFMNSNRVSMGN